MLEIKDVTKRFGSKTALNSVSLSLAPGELVGLFGENGANISDEDVQEYADANSYMTAKHILFKTTDDSGAALSDADKAAKKKQAEQVAAQIKAVTDPEKRVELFDQLMEQYNEDTGESSYPHGYCFTSGEMVSEFSEATAALEPGQLSDIVESSFGYHLILRETTSPDDSVMQYDSTGTPYDLRAVAAALLYDDQINGWIAGAEIVWEPGFEELDFNSLLGIA